MLGFPLNLFTLGLGGTSVSSEVGIVLQGSWYLGDMTSTMNGSFIVSYRITDSTKQFTEVRTASPTLVAGVNALQISDTINAEPYTFDYTINLVDSFTITTTPNAFSFVKAEQLTGLLTGGAYSQAIPFAGVNSSFQLQYMGGQDTLEGDYGIYYQFSDANGTTFYSTDNSQTFKWAPRVVIVAVDGNYNMRDALPDVAKSSVAVRYIVGLEVLTEDNEPVYDVDGKVIYFGDVSDEIEVAFDLDPSTNNIQITGVADDFGNLRDSDTRSIVRVPTLRYNGLTAIDEESFGTTYVATNTLIVDEGTPEEITVTPDEAPYLFTSGLYEAYNFTASYTYPTGGSNSVPVVIEYVEFAQVNPTTLAFKNFTLGTPNSDTSPDPIRTITNRSSVDYLTTFTDIGNGSEQFTQPYDVEREFTLANNGAGGEGGRCDSNITSYSGKSLGYVLDADLTSFFSESLDEFTVVVEITPDHQTGSFEYTILNNFGFSLHLSGTDKPNIRGYGISGIRTGANPVALNEVNTICIPVDNINNLVGMFDSNGNELALDVFNGIPSGITYNISVGCGQSYASNDVKCFQGIIHRFYVLPGLKTLADIQELHGQSEIDYGLIPPSGDGDTVTNDSYPEVTSDGYPIHTIQ